MGKHKRKDDKGSSKKDKKHHKEQKKSSSNKKKENRNPREGNSLIEVVAEAVANYPQLLDLLPPIIASLDRGGIESFDTIEDKGMKEILTMIMKKLQLVDYIEKKGWQRASAMIKIHKVIANDFLSQNPTRLVNTTHQTLAPAVMFAIILFFPDFILELPSLVTRVLDGKRIEVNNPTQQASFRQGLEVLLCTLGATPYKEGYKRQGSGHHARLAYKVLRKYQKCGQRDITFLSDDESSSSVSETESDSSDYSDDRKEKEVEENVKEVEQQEGSKEVINLKSGVIVASSSRCIGPERPPSNWEANYDIPEEEQDSEEEDVGPRPCLEPFALARPPTLLGQLGVELYDEGQQQQSSGSGGDEKEKKLQREEWIVDPGDSKALRALGGGEAGLFQGPRKFQSGKEAKKKAEALAIQREYLRKVAEQRKQDSNDNNEVAAEGSTGAADNDVVVERAPSLLEEHMQKRARLNEEQGKKTQSKERRPFDRELDVLSRKKLTQSDLMRLVENSKELEAKFDKANVQRNFL
eukprot:gene8773-9675_t